ncbi:GTPase/DUF3482 domain-containing protein [Desulfospira joergensenii]|uniref:GTPase/DUF3482 domain-containing protein n=1 Tax=Desulfospira joergensenii TaxID=53329 RepID=UPI0003B60E7C|nr:GTPase/DUF3482 domain-containing protein [Desulfospira joergensenii]
MKDKDVKDEKIVPEFAVLGHPNEGKSSVVSTLTEDDQIRVSRVPGETKVSRIYRVKVDGKEIIRFVDTPGFQVPRQTLEWFRGYKGDPAVILKTFIQTFGSDPFYADECELLTPVARGAGIIYVVDGSRPVRPDDIAEMEILRLTGRPRMAVINSKSREKDHTAQWRMEFRKHFNAIRLFNSNRADFHERIRMLESLKAIDQDWEADVTGVIRAFKEEMKRRNRLTAAYITQAIEKSLGLVLYEKITPESDRVMVRERLGKAYENRIKTIERELFKNIRLLFRHHLYEFGLPDCSVLDHDLFSGQTWELLGLTQKQLATAGAVLGGSMGVVADVAAHGLTFGLFTALGGVLGAGSAVMGGKKIAEISGPGIRLGGDRFQVGPNGNLQFLYILLDRALIYYSQIVNRAHGRRDAPKERGSGKIGFSSEFSPAQRNTCARFFKAASGRGILKNKKTGPGFAALVESLLEEIFQEK